MTRYLLEPLRKALQERIDQEGLRPFAARMDIPLGQIRSILDGRSAQISTVEKVARALGVKLEIGGADVTRPSFPERVNEGVQEGVGDSNTEAVDLRSAGNVPLLSWVQAGEWADVQDAFDARQCEEWVLCPVPHSQKTFVLRVRGASMQPDYADGDWIFVDPERAPENGSHVVVMLDDHNEATFKKLVIEGENKYLEALNPDWPDRIIRVNGNASFVGVVIFSGRPR